MEQVEGVKGHTEPLDQGVVASSHQPQRDHIDYGKNASAVSEQVDPGLKVAVEANVD